MFNDTNSLAHTKWNCKYHIVFAPKYRRKIIYGKLKRDIGIILRQLCERKGNRRIYSKPITRGYRCRKTHNAGIYRPIYRGRE